ncbi:hypothetical protein LXL04_010559 [Taraxacum kok-saghyz]
MKRNVNPTRVQSGWIKRHKLSERVLHRPRTNCPWEVSHKVAPSSQVMAGKSGKKAGMVSTALGSRGLGLLRIQEAFKGTANLVIKGEEDVKVEAVRPHWWPREWFLEAAPHFESGFLLGYIKRLTWDAVSEENGTEDDPPYVYLCTETLKKRGLPEMVLRPRIIVGP